MNSQWRGTLLNFGPAVAFYATFKFYGLYPATAAVMVAAVAALVIGLWLERKILPLPLITAVLVVVFGGLTLYLNNDLFIKMRPTMVYALLGATLLGGLIFKQHAIKYVMGIALTLTEDAWRVLSLRFGLFFLGMALLNELIWRNFSLDVWVNYHVFGAMALIFLFSLSQTPFMLKHLVESETPRES